ncbi:hypothetical protein PsYK624_107420 [Phanerochaete sordida]|uniref:PX domain-containing protein n=1 Tax=Phanerochaete sordida TaxID=48140 RepID=A0A9P3LHW7_9APHY|nr:hypothetical protein PsYK624_107420 [Phanerochaete sordida]
MELHESQLVQDRIIQTGHDVTVNPEGYYKRGVLKPPPKHFVVEVLPHRKMGSSFAYGMRIYPTNAAGEALGDAVSMRTSSSGSSSSSNGSTTTTTGRVPYEIWRRWEDCLWFQEQLEGEYRILSQQKRARLARGKGVKKDGLYVHSDRAASFESLPPGPDANDIAKDIHDVLPKLSKKGSFFKASKDIVETRQREFKALIETLWDDDSLPTLVREMREIRMIRDFFGYWNRDRDRERKVASLAAQDKGKSRMSMSSLTSSMFSSRPDPEFVAYPSSPYSASSLSLSRLSRPGSPVGSVSTAGASTVKSQSGRPRAASVPRLSSPLKSSVTPLTPVSTSTKARASLLSVPASVSERSLWSQDSHSPTTPSSHISFTVTENGALVPSAPWADGEDPLATSFLVFSTAAESKAKAKGGLEPLREESEADLEASQPGTPTTAPPSQYTAARTTPTGPPIVQPRPRNLSCPNTDFRNGQVWVQRTPRPPSVVSEVSVLASPTSTTSSEPSEQWEDALNDYAFADDAEHAGAPIAVARRQSVQGAYPARPSTMYSTFSTFSEQDSFFDDFGFDESWALDAPAGYASDGGARKRAQVRASVATMNSVMSDSSVDAVLPRRGFALEPPAMLPNRPDSSVDAVLPRRGFALEPPAMLPDRPDSPTPSSAASSSSEHTHMHASSPASSSPSLLTPNVDLQRSRSNGNGKYRVSIELPDSPLFKPEDENQWYDDQNEDLIDSYFYDPGVHTPSEGTETPHRERVSKHLSAIATPAHFPKPYQHRPPGQFHLPWSPTTTRPPSVASTVATPASPTSIASSAASEHFTVKAVRQDSIVLLRATHGEPLALVRTRLRDKFAAQEGVRLTEAFTIGFSPAPATSGRPRSHSASSSLDGRQQQPRLRFITCDEDWAQAAASCVGKLTIHVFDRF